MGTLVQEVVTGMLAALLRDSEHRFGSGRSGWVLFLHPLVRKLVLGFRAFLVAQLEKNLPAAHKTWV